MGLPLVRFLIVVLVVAIDLSLGYWQEQVQYQYSSPIGIQTINADIVVPQSAFVCKQADNPCQITLNVTAMDTMTFYERYDNGLRSLQGFPAEFANGSSGSPSRLVMADGYDPPKSPISRFLHPIFADGFRRTAYVVNDQLPGPVITAYRGQNMEVTVLNNIPQPMTMHWHGQHVNGAPWSDGTASVSQCTILPGDSYVYRFTVDQIGTHWYHAHDSAERSDGIYGGLIVKETTNSNVGDYADLPEKHTMILTDWFDDPWNVTFEQFKEGTFPDLVHKHTPYSPLQQADGTLASHYPFVSGLINGRGRKYHPNANNCSVLRSVPLSEFIVSNESSYRFRLIGVSTWHAFRVSIQGHKLRVIATDGEYITTNNTASEVDYVIVQSGERYDIVVIPTEPSPHGAYWIVAETIEDHADIISRSYCLRGHRAYGILRYGNDTSGDPTTFYDPLDRGCTSEDKCFAVNCPFQNYPHSYNISCINMDQVQAVAPISMPIDDNMETAFFNFLTISNTHISSNGINGRLYLSTNVPLLTQFDDIPGSWNFCDYPTGMHETRGKQCTHQYSLSSDVTEIVLMNLGNDGGSDGGGHSHGHSGNTGHGHGGHSGGHIHGHPIHLHGYHFRVLKFGYPTYHHGKYMADNTDVNCTDAFCEKGHVWNNRPNVTFNPLMPKKDSIIIPGGGYVIVRIERNNPGKWLLHCHIAPHQQQGMNLVIVDNSTTYTVPSNIPKCTVQAPENSSIRAHQMMNVFFLAFIVLLPVVLIFIQ